jgi:hypothetical protein
MTADLIERIPEMERRAADLERQAHALRQIIAGVRALNGEGEDSWATKSFESHRTMFEIGARTENAPRGPQAVLTVMREAPFREWKVVDLKRVMLRRGWAPSPKAVEASVKRLRLDGQIRSTSYGHYMLATPPSEDPGDGEASNEGVRADFQASLAS